MKNWILVLLAVMVLPKYQPLFDGMIVRCDEQGKCHWECEFGVSTSTTMVNDNLIVHASGCTPKTSPTSGTINIGPEQRLFLFPVGQSMQLNDYDQMISTVNIQGIQ